MNPAHVLSPGSYPFGAVYLLEPDQSWSETERDVAVMAEMGYDLVTLWPPANSWLASRPDEFCCAGTLRLLDLLHTRGMRAVIQLIGQNPAQEFLPDCLATPDMRVQDRRSGERRGQWPNCSWANPLHPGVDTLVRRYLREVMGQLRDHPAVWAWDLFNEAHLRTDDAWSVAAYRRWLEQRYGSIAALNHAWYRRYADFTQIDPADRMVPYSAWSSVLPQVDYEHFRAELTTSVCARWVGYAREHDAARPMIIDSTGCNLVSGDATLRNTDEFGVATTCDIYGGTYYPKSWGRDLGREPWTFALHLAVSAAAARSAGVPFVVNELQTHTQNALSPGSEVSPGELSSWIWSTIAAGSKAMQLWRQRPFLHGYQATGRGLTRLDGTPGPRAAAVSALITRLRRHQELIAHATPVAPVAMLMTDYRGRLVFDAFRDFENSRHAMALTGWWRLLQATGLPIAVGDLAVPDTTAQQSPVLVLPATIALDEAQCAWIAERVHAGALVIADARLAATDRAGVARAEASPGVILSPVFGFREVDVSGPVSGTIAGAPFSGGFLSQEVELLPGAEVLARTDDGRPLLIANRYGAGATLYLTCHAGEVWREQLPEALVAWFTARLQAVAPQAPRIICDGLLHGAVHQHGTQRLAYLVSWSDTPLHAVIAGITATAVQILDGDRLPVHDGSVHLDVPPRSAMLVTWETA
jgi:beta-galactosidase